MQRSSGLGWGIVGVLVLGAAGYFFWQSATDRPRATNFEATLTDLSSTAVEERTQAQAEIARQGTNLIPSLVSLLGPPRDGPGSDKHNQLEGTLKRQRLRQQAVVAFQLLGLSAATAEPDLVRLMTDTNSAPYAARALASIGAAEQLRQLLQSSNASTRASAALGLSGLKTNLSSVVDLLISAMGDPDAGVRASVVASLGLLATAPERSLPTLAAALKDAEPSVRLAAAKALGKFDRFDAAALPALEEAKNDRDPQVRRAVRRAISTLMRSEKQTR